MLLTLIRRTIQPNKFIHKSLIRSTHSIPFHTTIMSAAASSAAPTSVLNLLDNIIAQVESLPSSTASSSSGRGGLPTETKDKRWWPIIPVGHTAYTFYGVNDANPTGVASTNGPAAVAAPKPSVTVAAPVAAKPEEKKAAAKPAKGSASSSSAAAPAPVNDQPEYTKLDIRVGQIVKAARHPDPTVDKLYVEEIDVGEAQPRTIVSGLVPYIPIDVFEKSRVCVICNLKPSPLKGVVSNGMVLAASTGVDAARVVELIQPPAGSKPGDRITILEGDFSAFQPLPVVDPKKRNKKTNEPENEWSRVAATLKTNDAGEATWDGKVIGVKGTGAAKSTSLKNAPIA